MKKFIIMMGLILLTSCSYVNEYFGMEDDNLAEEVVEEVIKVKAGINIDLTPDSPEK